MAASASAPLLNLDTLIDQPTVVIDGIGYPLLVPDALSLIEYRKLAKLLPRLEALWIRAQQDTITEKEDAELGDIFKAVCATVLQAPPEILAKLTDLHRVAIYTSFLKLPSATLLRVGAMMQAERTPTPSPTGAKSSRSSRTTTPARSAIRSTGSPEPPSGSSGRIS